MIVPCLSLFSIYLPLGVFIRVWVCVRRRLYIILKWKSDALFPRRDKEKSMLLRNKCLQNLPNSNSGRFLLYVFFAMSHTTTRVQCFIICKFSTTRFLSFFCVFVSSFWATKEKRQYYVTVSHAFFTKQNSQEAYTAFWRGQKKIRKAGIEDEQEKWLL